MNKVLGNKKAISLFVVPALIIYTIIVMVPVIWSLYYSFFSGSPGLQWEFAGFDNYARLFRDKNFLNALTVNCKYVLVVTVGQVGMGLLLSLMFKFWLRRCKTIVRTLVFFPVVLPTVAVGQLFAKIYEIQPNYGLLNSLLDSLGFYESCSAMDRSVQHSSLGIVRNGYLGSHGILFRNFLWSTP